MSALGPALSLDRSVPPALLSCHAEGSQLAGSDMTPRADRGAYEKELSRLQLRPKEVAAAYRLRKRRAVVVFEGWDAAGKGGVIRRINRMLDPRMFKICSIEPPPRRSLLSITCNASGKAFPEQGADGLRPLSIRDRACREFRCGGRMTPRLRCGRRAETARPGRSAGAPCPPFSVLSCMLCVSPLQPKISGKHWGAAPPSPPLSVRSLHSKPIANPLS